jgi:hypothetical protein
MAQMNEALATTRKAAAEVTSLLVAVVIDSVRVL